MALHDLVDRLTPPWAKAVKRVHWWSLWRLAAVLVDTLIEGVYQGRKAGMPNAVDLPGVPGYGGFEDVASLDYIGRDRGVYHGLTEPPTDYAERLRKYIDADAGGWAAAGLVSGVLEQLAGILGPTPPLMRIVNRQGEWWTRYQDGSYTQHHVTLPCMHYALDGTTSIVSGHAHAWDWDSATEPPPVTQGDPGDWWLILYAPLNTPYGTITDQTFDAPGIVGDLWNDPTTQAFAPSPWAGTVGTNAPIVLVDLIRSVIAQRACAGFRCLWIVVAFDPDSFEPLGTSAAAYPDGHWGQHSKFDSGTNARIPARLDSAEYWPGAIGGRDP